MRSLLAILGVVAATAAFGGSASAQNYPWCANYGGGEVGGGGLNCGFTTFQQCMTTLAGMGGFCERNTQYVPSRESQPSSAPRRSRHRTH